MATREVITYDCDRCHRETEVRSHAITVDRKTVKVDACDRCWEKFMKVAGPWLQAGRSVKKINGRKRAPAQD